MTPGAISGTNSTVTARPSDTTPTARPSGGPRVQSFSAATIAAEILFADFGIERPTILAVLSLEDSAVLELQVVLERE